MKKTCLLFLIVSLVLPGMVVRAQHKTLELYYIAHDHYETAISSILSGVRNDARNNPDRAVVFYLANGSEPMYFLVSPEDDDAWSAFNDELNAKTAHPVSPLKDRDTIMSIMAGEDCLPSKGFDEYDKVILNFFVTPGFVSMDYGDTLIGGLYWNMDLDNLPASVLKINVLPSPDGELNANRLFGRKKLTGQFPVRISSF